MSHNIWLLEPHAVRYNVTISFEQGTTSMDINCSLKVIWQIQPYIRGHSYEMYGTRRKLVSELSYEMATNTRSYVY